MRLVLNFFKSLVKLQALKDHVCTKARTRGFRKRLICKQDIKCHVYPWGFHYLQRKPNGIYEVTSFSNPRKNASIQKSNRWKVFLKMAQFEILEPPLMEIRIALEECLKSVTVCRKDFMGIKRKKALHMPVSKRLNFSLCL